MRANHRFESLVCAKNPGHAPGFLVARKKKARRRGYEPEIVSHGELSSTGWFR